MRRTTFFKWLQISCFLLVSLVGTERAAAQCPVVTLPVQTFCDVESPAVSSLVATDMGGGVVWYATATSTTPLSPTAGLVSGEDYFAGDASGNCTERQSVVVTIYSAPTGLNFQGPCVETPEEATIADLVAVGNNIQWYDTPTGGTPLPYSTILSDNTIYYASQTNPNTGCESSRMSVFVNVGLVPVPQGDALQRFCNLPDSPPTVANLQPGGPGYRWYATISSAVPLPLNTPLIDGETYYATSVDPPCESENRLEITVELITPNNAGVDGLLSFCENAITPGQTVDLFTGLGASADVTGFWTGPAAIANGHLGTVDVSALSAAGSPYTFVYRVESSECPAATATVTVEILPPPTASIKATPILCEATEGIVTITGTPGATVVYTANGEMFSIVLDASGIGQIIGPVDVTTEYTLVSVTSDTDPACTTLLAESATIQVLPLPVVTASSSGFICLGDTAVVVFTGTPGATVSFSVNGGPAQSLVLDASGQAVYENAFSSDVVIELISVSSSDTLLCTRELSQVLEISVQPLPVVSILGATEICPGQSTEVTFTGAPGTLVRFTVNSGEIQEIVIGPVGVATLETQYTETTIIDLVEAISAEPYLCPAPVNGSVTITVAELPVAALSSDVEICEGETAVITISGTPGATVWYTVNAGTPVSVVLDASGQAQISGMYTETTVISLTSVWSAGPPSCEQIPEATVTIFVTPLPVISLNEDVQICPGQTALVTFTGTPGATVNYTVNGVVASIVIGESGTAEIEQTYTQTTTYVLVSAQTSGTPSCTAPQTGQMTVEVLPPPFVNISGEAGICAGEEAVITFNGTPGAVVSYTINNGAVQTIVLDASGTAQITQVFIEDALYTLVGVSLTQPEGCDFPAGGQVQITVSDLPVVAISGDATICEGQQATISFTGTPAAIVTYAVNGGAPQTIVLDDFGNAQLTQTFSETTVITLIGATVPGISTCTQPQAGTVTITVLPLPSASLSQDQQVCIGEQATVVFTGTPGALISYTVNGVAQTILLDAGGSASITATYTETTTYVLVSAQTQTPECEQSLSETMTVTVVPAPQAQIISTQAVCAGQPASIPIQGTPGAIVSYTVNNGAVQSIGLDATGNAVITGNFADGDLVTLVQVSTGAPLNCSVSLDDSTVVQIITPSVVSISESDEICAGGSATVTFTGDPNAIVNYTVNGAPQTIVLDASGTASLTQVFNATTVFALVSVTNSGTPSCTQPLSESITINVVPLPDVTVPGTVLFCAGTSATVTLNGTPGAVLTYLINGNPTPQTVVFDAAGTATLTGFSTTTSVTLVSVSLPMKPFCQRVLGQSFTITPVALPTVSISVIGDTSVCAGQSAVVQFSGTPNSTVIYTANGEVQTILLNASGLAFLTSNLLSETTYALVSVTANQAPFCSQPQSGSVTVDVIPTPVAGNDVAEVIFCQNSTPVDLFSLLGPNAEAGGSWTPALASGTGVFNPALDAAGIYFYTVDGTGDCPGDTASVTVLIEPVAQAGNDGTAEVCSNQGAVDLFALLGPSAQTGGTWTPALASGTGVFDPLIDAAGTYIYTVTFSDFCPADSAQVNVIVVPGPEAGTDGELVICENSGLQNLFDALGGNPAQGGFWTPALASGNGIFDPAVDAPGVYTYQFIGPNPCDDDAATVTVTVQPAPYAGQDALAVLCSNDAPTDLLTLLSGTPQAGGVWTPALASGNGIFDPEADAPGLYTYTVGGGLCPSDSATLIVQVIQSPQAGQDGFLQTCVSLGVVDLTTALDGTQGAGVWTDDDATGALVGNLFNTALVAEGTYHFTYTVAGGTSPCNTDTATVTVEVSAQVEAGTFTDTLHICADAETFNLFDLLSNYDEGGQWTDGNGAEVPAVISLEGLPTGPALYTYSVTNGCGTDAVQATFVIDPIPQLTSVNISVPGLVCAFADLPVSLGAMPDGNYTLTYHLSGANVHADQTGIATITGGLGTLVIPGNLLSNAGATTLNIVNILNAETICGNSVEHAAVNFYVNPVPDLAQATISIATVCFGENVLVSIADADLLSDGTYVFDYTISGFGEITFSSGPVSIVSGEGNFSVSSNVFSAPGSYTLTIVGMFNQAGGCGNTTMQYPVTFEIIPTPDLSLIFISINDACLDFGTTVTVEGLSDGVYSLSYQLSGQSTAFGTVQLVVEEGTGSFELPATDIPNLGVVNFAVTQLEFTAGECGFTGTTPTVSFEVKPLQTPELSFRGNLFCETRNPTIADLSANIIGNLEVIWYDAPIGGTAYAPGQLLVHGQTYYAAFAPGQGCESTIRLAVVVDLTHCFELLIPDGFSPNNDGINDDFEIVNLIELYPDFKLEIYNRYGNLLYKGDRNTPNWDGTVSEGGLRVGSSAVPTGVYFYILEFNDGHRKPLQGRVYLNR